MCGPPPGTIHRTLPHDATAPRRARTLVEEAAPDIARSVMESVRLIVSELVTNAVQHSEPQDGIEVTIVLRDGTIHGEVRDGGRPRPEGSRKSPSLGVGLKIVDQLATDWGTETTPDGRTAWFELPAS